jgi:peptide/nickel transport system substrate-binding protein
MSLALLFSLALAACGSTSNNAKRTGPPQPLVIVANTGGDLVQNFNPFLNGSVNSYGQFGPIYETLMFFNRADGTSKGWLADSATYSSDATQITFKLHQASRDGRPTVHRQRRILHFQRHEQYDAADYLGITSSIDSVSSPDPQTVVIKLNSLIARSCGSSPARPDSARAYLVRGRRPPVHG